MKHLVVVAMCAALFAASSQAAAFKFSTILSGANENPVNASPATGRAYVTYDDVLHTIAVEADWSGLTGTTTAAHIHCCIDAPANVGVATYPVAFPGFPLGVSSGTYSNFWDLTDPASFTAGFVTNFGGGTLTGAETALFQGLQAGRAYLNIHTTLFPGGEIRGFLQPVPEPGTIWLFAGACALFAGYRRRWA